MLCSLDIRDVLIIERLELDFSKGLNVLTGETGAGKSILLDSLGFVLGWRGRAELVRSGAKQGEVTAIFQLPPHHPAFAILNDAGFEVEDEIIIRRINTTDGRKTAWINDRRVSGEILRLVSETLVELHGQHDDRGLLNPKNHLYMLDSYAGLEAQSMGLRQAWKSWQQLNKQHKEATTRLTALQAEEEYLRHAVNELQKLGAQAGEESTLDEKRRRMQSAERIRGDITKGRDALSLNGAEGQMSDAARWLSGASLETDGHLDRALEALDRATVELTQAQNEVDGYLETLSFSPQDLEDTEERLFSIRAAARKYDVFADELADHADILVQQLSNLDAGQSDLHNLESEMRAAKEAYHSLANKLSSARKTAGEAFDCAVMQELAPLKMERAIFTTDISQAPEGPDGFDRVIFTAATNPGAPFGPLNKIASGGELSRFLLALKVCLTQSQHKGFTIIFDEIDRGVGGATADAVGRRLLDLSNEMQVLTVTHSPQVAALGHQHLRIEKHQSDAQTLSTVVKLSPDERVHEIARMISGDVISEAAQAAARELLAQA